MQIILSERLRAWMNTSISESHDIASSRSWQWDYKTRISNQTEVIEKFRQMLRMMLQQKHRFKEACIDTEAYLKVRT